MFAHHPFELLAFVTIAAVINSIGVKEKDVSWIQQCDVGDIGGVRSSLPELQ